MHMSSRLDRIKNWRDLAGEADYNPIKLAILVRVSYSTLNRFCVAAFAKTPELWLVELRMAQAMKLLATTNLSIKEIAFSLKYKHVSLFLRHFKDYFRCCPMEWSKRNSDAMPRHK
jgi:AraC-like DNA-binding protein